MSIRRQLALGISLLMVLIMGANLLLSIQQLKSQYEKQLTARADETVTTLALSMTHNAALKDDASLRSMIDVVFDGGQYLQVRFDYIDSATPVMRSAATLTTKGVPQWFKNIMPIRGGFAEANVIQGWNQLGLLQVQLHPSSVYKQLWQQVKAELAWFAMMIFSVVYGMRLLLAWQLKPLKSLTDLADKLASNQFSRIKHEPKAKELKSLVRAMNHLSDRLQASFIAHGETVHNLKQENYHDALTELHNRKGWGQFLEDWLKPDGFAPSWMMLIRINNLTRLNQEIGKTQVDEVLMQIAVLLKTDSLLNHEHVCTARIGGEFWVLSPDPLDHSFQQRIEQLCENLLRLSLVQEYQVIVRMVALPIYEIVAPSSIKHQMDLLMERAQAQQSELLIGQVENHTFTNWVHWQKRLKTALQQEQVDLFVQGVFDRDGHLIQQEVHCRLQQSEGESLLAGYFWPMVDRLNLSIEFDQLVIKKWLAQSHKSDLDWALNLSGKSLNDATFRSWFEMTLPTSDLQKLIIECSEYTLVYLSEDAVQWLHSMASKGLRLSVDHVGTSGKSFGFLARYPIYQGKIEKRFIRDIDQHSEHAFFVSAMTHVFKAQQALCVAEGVENEREKSALLDLGVDAVMGYALAKPRAL